VWLAELAQPLQFEICHLARMSLLLNFATPPEFEMSERFQTFLLFWTAENIHSLGDHTDPSDWNFLVRRKADELVGAARIAGFYGELVEAAHPFGGVEAFVWEKFEEASRQR
jgi:hypothetical protein